MPEFPVVTLTPGPFACVTIATPVAGIAGAMAEGFCRLGDLFARAGAEMAGMPMCHYVEADQTSATFQLGFPCRPDEVAALRAAGLSIVETPSGEAMKAVHIGPYDDLTKTYAAMAKAMEAHGRIGSRDMWEVYCSPPETPPQQIRTEVLWPLQPA